MAQTFLGDAPVRFDERVHVIAPESAEDAMRVPVFVSVDGLDNVRRVLVFADLSPIPKVLDYFPEQAEPSIGFSFKVEQSTPLRAAVLTDTGWHVGGVFIGAAGGGCTAPSATTGGGMWSDRLGEMSARVWSRSNGSRLKIRVMHPMDTGLAPGIPVFYIEAIAIENAAGQVLARLHPFEPVSENPVFTLDVHGQGPVMIRGRDIQANVFAGRVAP